MKKTYIPIVIVLLLVVVGGILVFAKRGPESTTTTTSMIEPPPTTITETPNEEVPPPVQTPPPPAPAPAQITPPPASVGRFSDEGDIEGNDVQVVQIEFDGKSFSPASVTIKNGDIVVFKNNSKSPFWPASDPHPNHTAYPAFDSDSAVAAGKTFQFKFTKVGTWGFHDHITPTAKGKVVVTD